MEKIMLIMHILLLSLSFSESLDKYESKRMFDEMINYIITGDYEGIMKAESMTLIRK